MEDLQAFNPSQLWKKWIRSIRSIGGGPTGIQLVSEVVGVVGVGVVGVFVSYVNFWSVKSYLAGPDDKSAAAAESALTS